MSDEKARARALRHAHEDSRNELARARARHELEERTRDLAHALAQRRMQPLLNHTGRRKSTDEPGWDGCVE
jgi:hypothetical protein